MKHFRHRTYVHVHQLVEHFRFTTAYLQNIVHLSVLHGNHLIHAKQCILMMQIFCYSQKVINYMHITNILQKSSFHFCKMYFLHVI